MQSLLQSLRDIRTEDPGLAYHFKTTVPTEINGCFAVDFQGARISPSKQPQGSSKTLDLWKGIATVIHASTADCEHMPDHL